MHVVATAGHVDHGKSSLVKALTGTDPDRFEEERRRGLTIDLGFAGATLPSGRRCAIIDVPGHIRFIANMLAGVGATDACIFVVAATEGWKPQSEEHLRILELLGIRAGIVAVTMADLVDSELAEIALLDVADHLAGTFLADAEIVATDSISGTGMADFAAALDRLLARTPTAADVGRPRLWVDRSFVAAGSGTVVTGTLTGGAVAIGDEMVVRPLGRSVRVRGIQSLYSTQRAVTAGHRAALNLAGINHAAVSRGDVVVNADQWQLTNKVDASLQVLASLDHDVSRRGAYVAYLGAGEFPARLRILGAAGALGPGSEGLVRLHLPCRLPLLPGDRFVLRESGRGETVGGGEILDVDPVLPASLARPDRSVARVIAERGWVSAGDLFRMTGVRREPDLAGWVTDPATRRAAEEEVRARVAEAGDLGLDLATLSEQHRAIASALEDVVLEAGRAKPARHADLLAEHPFLAALEERPFSPPGDARAAAMITPAELREMQRRGLVVTRDGVTFAASAVVAAAVAAAELLADRPDGFTVSEFRDHVRTTRKFALPLLAELDANGVTRRRGDLRIAGRRLGHATATGAD